MNISKSDEWKSFIKNTNIIPVYGFYPFLVSKKVFISFKWKENETFVFNAFIESGLIINKTLMTT